MVRQGTRLQTQPKPSATARWMLRIMSAILSKDVLTLRCSLRFVSAGLSVAWDDMIESWRYCPGSKIRSILDWLQPIAEHPCSHLLCAGLLADPPWPSQLGAATLPPMALPLLPVESLGAPKLH